MDRPLVDRRVDERFGQPAIAGTQAILRPGYSVALIDLSAGGALIEGPRPLRPGMRVHVQLVSGTHRFGLTAHVLRCAVARFRCRRPLSRRAAVRRTLRSDLGSKHPRWVSLPRRAAHHSPRRRANHTRTPPQRPRSIRLRRRIVFDFTLPDPTARWHPGCNLPGLCSLHPGSLSLGAGCPNPEP